MPEWTGDPLLAGFDPSTHSYGFDYHFATPGSVDVEAITRLQHLAQVPPSNSGITNNTAPLVTADMSWVLGDMDNITAYWDHVTCTTSDQYTYTIDGHRYHGSLSTVLYIAQASAFSEGYVPTPQEIYDNCFFQSRGDRSFSYASGDSGTIVHNGPRADQLTPNTKYWVMVCPTATLDPNIPASKSNDVPYGGSNYRGRALSFWTNRTPLAPAITAPVGSVSLAFGATVDVVFTPNDPDKVTPSDTERDNDDLYGIQIQYAQASSPGVTPNWQDLPYYGADQSLSTAVYLRSEGATAADKAKIIRDLGLTIKCGDAGVAQTSKGLLPPGDWQIRCRTFDSGIPWGIGYPPAVDGGDLSQTYTLANYPASNTSPWSVAKVITVTAQVPPPIPLYPIEDIAVQDGTTVRFTWQYRNSVTPPYPQQGRNLQIRRVGETDWFTLVDDAFGSHFFDVTSGIYTLEATTEYEWRVQTEDTTASMSEWSQIARFWVVPSLNSGETRHPDRTIESATLGCGRHRAFIYRKGGKIRVGELTGITHLDWSRVRDDISTAKVIVEDWSVDCGNMLSLIRSWAYELVIFRDNGYSVDRVWEGPVTLPSWRTDQVIINAKDLMVWPYRRIIKQAFNDVGTGNGDTVVNRARRILQTVLAPDDPNILQYLTVYANASDSMEYRVLPPWARTAYEEIDDMAANAGLDYTTVGRAIILWGTKSATGLLPEFRDENFGASPIVSEYGMSFANRFAVTDGNGIYGEANRLNSEGGDPDYGLVEMLSSTFATDTGDDTGTLTQEGLQNLVQSFEDSSARSISNRYPPPLVVRVPDGTTLSPSTLVSINQLVPGVIIPLRSTGTLREINSRQKLDKVQVVEEAGNETISITLSPFATEDIATEVTEE